MRATMLSWLPHSLEGRRILDAGCGTGLMAVELARRGAEVLAIDLSPRMIELARERLPEDVDPSRIDFRSGDMLNEDLGYFDHVVAMDSLIHYEPRDVVRALGALSARTVDSMVITFAPRTPLLGLMHSVGRAFPRSDRAPAIRSDGQCAPTMTRDKTTKVANTAITKPSNLNFPPEGSNKQSSVTAATTVMLWPEGREFAAAAGTPIVCITPGSSTPKGLGCENQDFNKGDNSEPMKKHFRESAVPWRVKRVKTSSSSRAAPPSPNWVRKDQTGSMPTTAWFKISIHS
jgi:magnesium-protoporphyrin O-methyltransferase